MTEVWVLILTAVENNGLVAPLSRHLAIIHEAQPRPSLPCTVAHLKKHETKVRACSEEKKILKTIKMSENSFENCFIRKLLFCLMVSDRLFYVFDGNTVLQRFCLLQSLCYTKGILNSTLRTKRFLYVKYY